MSWTRKVAERSLRSMTVSSRSLRLLIAIVGLAALIAVIALPVLAADPSGSPSPAASEPTPTADARQTPESTPEPTPAPTAEPTPEPTPEPTAAPASDDDGDGTQMPEKPPKPDKPDKADKAKGQPVTVSGTVGTRTTADGDVEYILDTGSAVLVLDAGPPWFFGDDHPLQDHVGQTVTIVGEQRAGEDEVDVETVDGVRLREPGKPPWAGGWKVVGERHPGWSAEKAERRAERDAAKAKQHGTTCWPPGHCKGEAEADAETGVTNPPGD